MTEVEKYRRCKTHSTKRLIMQRDAVRWKEQLERLENFKEKMWKKNVKKT